MNQLFKTGIAGTCILGFIFSKIIPIQMYFGEEMEKQFLVEGLFVAATLVYLTYTLWKSLLQRFWIKALLISGILFFAFITGYLLIGFVVQPILISTALTFRLLDNNDSNIIWYWPFGISIAAYVLYALTNMVAKIIRGETFLF